MTNSIEIRCPAYGPAKEGTDQIPVCYATGISGAARRSVCPQGVRQGTDADCFVVAPNAHFIPIEFLSKWREIMQRRIEDNKRRIG